MARKGEAKNDAGKETRIDAAVVARELSERFTVEHLKRIYWTFSGDAVPEPVKKGELCGLVADLVAFSGQADYDRFYASQVEPLRSLLDAGIFCDAVDCASLKPALVARLFVVEKERYSRTISLNPQMRVHCFVPENDRFVRLVEPFKSIFRRYAPRPPEWEFESVEDPRGATWSNERDAADNLALLVAEMGSFITYSNRYARSRKKPLKGEVKTLRARSGLPQFPLSKETGLEPIELFVKLVAALHPEPQRKPADVDAWVATTVRRFFLEEKTIDPFTKRETGLCGPELEFSLLSGHLADQSNGNVFDAVVRPPSRDSFRWLLGEIAPSGAWYRTDRLLATLEARGKLLSFLSREAERWPLCLRGKSIEIAGVTIQDNYDERIDISGPLHRAAVYRPLFNAYCYALALFGILEISETAPERPVYRGGKLEPVSAFDALECVRVTEYGRWCLGLSATKPERVAGHFEAIADRDLLLVTFRGKSLERKLFLEEIGERLGEDRFKVSEVSFTRGCKRSGDLESRIARFTELIEKDPSPRWQEFFRSLTAREGLFSHPEPAFLFDLTGQVPSVAAAIFGDPKLSEIALRAEGCRVVVPESRYRQFVKLLAEHGFVTPDEDWR